MSALVSLLVSSLCLTTLNWLLALLNLINIQKNYSGKKFPCSICYKTGLANQTGIQCDVCALWWNCTKKLWKLALYSFQHENIMFILNDDTVLENIDNSNDYVILYQN